MEVKKRFRNKFIWEAKWYMDLSPAEKLLWEYIYDHCDNIGVWEPNFKLAEFHVGLEFDEVLFLKKANQDRERLIILGDGNWFFPDFTKFQYADGKKGVLSPNNASHKSYLKLMIKRGLWDWFCQNYPVMMQKAAVTTHPEIEELLLKTGLRGPSEESKDKAKEKNKEQEREKEQDKDKKLIAANSTNIIINKNRGSNRNNNYYKAAEEILQAYPRVCKESESISVIGTIEGLLEQLSQYKRDPVTYLFQEVSKLDKKKVVAPGEYFETLLTKETKAPF